MSLVWHTREREALLKVLDAMERGTQATLDYTNHRGERRARVVVMHSLVHGGSEWHMEPQWLLRAYDVEKRVMRDFAVRDVHGVAP